MNIYIEQSAPALIPLERYFMRQSIVAG